MGPVSDDEDAGYEVSESPLPPADRTASMVVPTQLYEDYDVDNAAPIGPEQPEYVFTMTRPNFSTGAPVRAVVSAAKSRPWDAPDADDAAVTLQTWWRRHRARRVVAELRQYVAV